MLMTMHQPSYSVDICFRKYRELVFISHLDLVRLLLRTMRRAHLPLVYTQGFSPRPKVSFTRAVPVGVSAAREQMVMYVTQRIDIKAVQKQLNRLLPRGIRIRSMDIRTAQVRKRISEPARFGRRF